jgi:hypothetical protein
MVFASGLVHFFSPMLPRIMFGAYRHPDAASRSSDAAPLSRDGIAAFPATNGRLWKHY